LLLKGLEKVRAEIFTGIFTCLAARADLGLCSVVARPLLANATCAGCFTVPSLDDWEKGWNEKLKADTLKPEMPKLKVVPVDFRSQQVVPQDMEAEAPLAATV
jgi:hypothetical protein